MTCPKPAKQLAILVPANNDKASEGFIAEIRDAAQSLAVATRILYRADGATTKDFVEDLQRWGSDPSIGGAVLILPLPPGVDRESVLSAMPILKDIDCLNPETKGIMPPASRAVYHIWFEIIPKELRCIGDPCKVAMVGRGLLIGKPIARFLSAYCHPVSVFGRNSDLSELAEAELVILGTGVPKLISPTMLKPGAAVIDFGYPGDFDSGHPEADKIGWYVPAKGGTGPLLVACLMETFYQLTVGLK